MSAASGRRPVGVAVAGFGWMGRVHARAYARVLHHFPDLPLAPRLAAVADEAPGRAEEAAAQFGFATAPRDWRELAGDPAGQAVSITAPNFLHREIGVAMAQAGKHLWVEKPVGLTSDDARAVADAARQAGVQGTVGFNYRNAPAVAAARELAAHGVDLVWHLPGEVDSVVADTAIFVPASTCVSRLGSENFSRNR